MKSNHNFLRIFSFLQHVATSIKFGFWLLNLLISILTEIIFFYNLLNINFLFFLYYVSDTGKALNSFSINKQLNITCW